jgi:hypothetical protein
MRKGIHRFKCKCGGEIVMNDFRRVSSHSIPECKEFTDACNAAGENVKFAEELDELGNPKAKGKA